MKFKDLFKNSVLEGFNTDITTTKICVTLGIALLLGIYIFFVYRYKSKTAFYSCDFNNVLAGLPVVTAGIVLSMQASIVISLGMVGALSIVRFRNAVKSSLDLLFLFWSISIGIICGAGIYEIGFILSFVITILLFVLDLIPVKNASLLLVINAENLEIEGSITQILTESASSYKVKSRSVSRDSIDLIIELKSNQEVELVRRCAELEGIVNVNLLSHDGEIRV